MKMERRFTKESAYRLALEDVKRRHPEMDEVMQREIAEIGRDFMLGVDEAFCSTAEQFPVEWKAMTADKQEFRTMMHRIVDDEYRKFFRKEKKKRREH
jgi:uncharacterized protein (DUF885 family)